jgi:hypothetical protein
MTYYLMFTNLTYASSWWVCGLSADGTSTPCALLLN